MRSGLLPDRDEGGLKDEHKQCDGHAHILRLEAHRCSDQVGDDADNVDEDHRKEGAVFARPRLLLTILEFVTASQLVVSLYLVGAEVLFLQVVMLVASEVVRDLDAHEGDIGAHSDRRDDKRIHDQVHLVVDLMVGEVVHAERDCLEEDLKEEGAAGEDLYRVLEVAQPQDEGN